MRPSIKNRWIRALLSGKYEQARSVLRHHGDGEGDEFCCLGVLCDIIDPKAWGPPPGRRSSHSFRYKGGGAYTTTLPEDLRDHLNIEDGDVDTLINLNDTQGADFEEIADWIRENL